VCVWRSGCCRRGGGGVGEGPRGAWGATRSVAEAPRARRRAPRRRQPRGSGSSIIRGRNARARRAERGRRRATCARKTGCRGVGFTTATLTLRAPAEARAPRARRFGPATCGGRVKRGLTSLLHRRRWCATPCCLFTAAGSISYFSKSRNRVPPEVLGLHSRPVLGWSTPPPRPTRGRGRPGSTQRMSEEGVDSRNRRAARAREVKDLELFGDGAISPRSSLGFPLLFRARTRPTVAAALIAFARA
jgi:hypothetical protein